MIHQRQRLLCVLLFGLFILQASIVFANGPYTDNGNGTITDETTGLMWQKTDDGTSRSLNDALVYCENLSFAGYSDWRLPNVNELLSISDTRYNPAIDPIFICLSAGYWSSSTLVLSADNAWYVDFNNGNDISGKITNSYYVRAVRTPPSVVLYNLNISPTTGGTVMKSPDKTNYSSGEVVTLTAIPNTCYTFLSWSGDVSGASITTTITMNGNKTVTANFSQSSYSLNVSAIGGSVSKNPNKTTYSCNEIVTLTATPNSCYSFSSWSGDALGTSSSTTITMNSNKTVTANFSLKTYSLNVSASGGTVTKSPNKTTYSCNETVTLTASPNTCYSFSNWSGDASGTSSSITITMNSNKTVTANFSQQTYSLNVSASGGTVTKSPNKTTYSCNEIVTLTAMPNSCYSFSSWSGDASGTSSSTTITINGNKTVTANFSQSSYSLNVTAIGGTVTKNPNKNTYSCNETVTLTAIPDTCYNFSSWSGDASGTSSSTTITMNSNKTVTANFSQQTYSLNVSASGGNVTKSPNKTTYSCNETVTLTASPSSGYGFTSWSGDAAGTNTTTTITMNGNKTVTANFSAMFTLSKSINPVGCATIDVSPDKEFYTEGETITLTVTPAACYSFANWSGDGSGTNAKLTLSMNTNKSVVANCTQKTFTLTVNAANGNVALSPQKIAYNCNETVSLSANPNEGYLFIGWSGDGSGSTNPLSLVMDKNKTVTAQFEAVPESLRLTPTATPQNGAAPLSVAFTVSITGGKPPYVSSWDCGDGTFLQGETTSHIYSTPGTYTVKITIKDSNAQTATKELIMRVDEASQGIGKAIIVAGGGAYIQNTLFDVTRDLSNRMYQLLRKRGYTDSDLFYLNPYSENIIENIPEKVTDNQLVNGVPDMQAAFNWAHDNLKSGEQFVFYFHGHGYVNKLQLNQTASIDGDVLKGLLDSLPAENPKLIIIDCCYSGSLLEKLNGPNRVIISSSDNQSRAWNGHKAESFTKLLSDSLRRGKSIFESFQAAMDKMKADKLFNGQTPWMDDTGDGIYSQTSDGRVLASNMYIGKEGIAAASSPEITRYESVITLTGENHCTATIWTKATTLEGTMKKVSVFLIPPDFSGQEYNPEDVSTGFLKIEEIDLIYNAAQDRWENVINRFNTAGTWRILYQAEGSDGEVSETKESQVIAVGGCASVNVVVGLNKSIYMIGDVFSFTMDLIGNGTVDMYAALVFPGGFFMTIAYPLSFSMPTQIIPYLHAQPLTDKAEFIIFEVPLPKIQTGDYTACGVVTQPGTDPWDAANWIHFDCKPFKIQ
ncbi:MAG: DUF1566 domain-containing protein [Desulfobacterales bacterium]|nr:DUF1566 domain-containing protein [Desulfobacterales bacterium]